jgi:hypothetical protein
MILSNTVSTSVVLNGATSTVSTPADENAPNGFMPASNGKSWVAASGPVMAITALGTVTTAANLDCTLASYFTLTGTAGDAIAMTFGTGSSTGAFSCQLGQVIKIRVTASGSTVNTMSWTGYTIAWVGMLSGTGGASSSAPVFKTSTQAEITLVCTGTGSTPTFDGTYLIGN